MINRVKCSARPTLNPSEDLPHDRSMDGTQERPAAVQPSDPGDRQARTQAIPEAQLATVETTTRILAIGRSKVFDLMSKGVLERRRIDGCTRITMRSINRVAEGK